MYSGAKKVQLMNCRKDFVLKRGALPTFISFDLKLGFTGVRIWRTIGYEDKECCP